MRRAARWTEFLAAAVLALLCSAVASGSTPPPPDREIMVMVPHPPDHFRPGTAYGGTYGDQLARSARERLARAIARDYGLTLVDDYPMAKLGIDCFIMAVPSGHSTAIAIEKVSRDRRVSWSQPVTMFEAQGAGDSHNDPLFSAQPAASHWRLASLHRASTGRRIQVAVIDSAVDLRHPDLAGQIARSRNFVAGSAASAEIHGTAVAGIIAAKADNRLGIAGIAPGAQLIALRACRQRSPSTTNCDGFSLAKALYFAIEQKSDVINLSLSGPNDRLLRELVKLALLRGQSVVAAYDQNRSGGGFPANVPGVFAVSNHSLAGSPRSVYIAPGQDVPTTMPGGRWFLVTGSSYAAAHVSGLVALLRERRASAPLSLVSDWQGGGSIDACASLRRVHADCDCRCATSRQANARPAS